MAKVGRKENGMGSVKRLTSGKIQCSIETQDEYGKRKIITATASKESEARQKAQDKLKQYKALLMNGKQDEKGLASQTLETVMGGKWFDDYAEGKWRSRTKTSRKNDLAILYRKLGSVRLDKITTQMINNFFAEALTPTNRQRLGMVYSILNDFFDDMYANGIIEANVFGRGIKKLPSPKKVIKEEYTLEEIELADFEGDVKFFKDDEVKKLKGGLDHLDVNGNIMCPRLPIYLLMLQTGMRGQEARALTIDDINFNAHTIRINKAVSTATDENGKERMILKSTKTSASNRIIKINFETEGLLKRIITERKCTDPKCKILYCTSSGNWVSKDNFARDFRKILQKLDVEPEGRGPHSLRHTFASLALEGNELSPLKNESALTISSYLGHATLDITFRIYTHLDKNKLKNIQLDEKPNIIEIEFN